MELNEGELVGLIVDLQVPVKQPFNLLTGVYEPSEVTITLDGQLLNSKVIKSLQVVWDGPSKYFVSLKI